MSGMTEDGHKCATKTTPILVSLSWQSVFAKQGLSIGIAKNEVNRCGTLLQEFNLRNHSTSYI